MVNSPDVDRWVRRAEEDVRAAEELFRADRRGLAGPACFHCQQAAEKYLKACLVRHETRFPKTHDLEQLVQLCRPLAEEFEQLAEATARLQPYAVNARYGEAPRTSQAVEQALAQMRQVRSFCRTFLQLQDQ